MTAFVFANFSKGFLKTMLETAGTIIHVELQEAITFPQVSAGLVIRCVLEDDTQDPEIVDISNNLHSGTMTLVRGRENTAIRQWPAGTRITPIVSAGILTELEALKP